jgi:sulfur-oxidizing protein SoxY
MTSPISRRHMLALAASAAGMAVLPIYPSLASPEAAADEVARFTDGQTPESGKVRLIVAERVENGSAVPLAVEVDSAMEGDDLVEAVIVLAERNPNPIIATFHFSALSGAASVSTRVRLATTQKLIAIARMSDGRYFIDEREVDVAIGGCVT